MGRGIGVGIGIGIGKIGAKLNQILLTFITTEQSVGQINEPTATSFSVTEGADTFAVDGLGNITFLSAPDYDTQRTYSLKIKSNTATYIIAVFVTILTTTTVLDGTEIMYNDTYIKAA